MSHVTPTTGRAGWASRIAAHGLFWPLLSLLLLIAANALVHPGFLALQWRDGHLYGSLIDILNRAAPLILVAMGMTLVIAVRGLDISVGAVLALSAAVAAWTIGGDIAADGAEPGLTLLLAIGAALGVAALCGVWHGALVVFAGVQPIAATLILMVAGRGIAQLVTGGQILTVYDPAYAYIGNGSLLGLPFALLLALAVFAAMQLLLSRTALGLFVRAIGANPVASRIAGLRARAITLALYVFCGLCAGLAGLVISANVRSADANNAGQLIELDAILAVTLGGTLLSGGRFSLAGSLIGALIIQTLTTTIYTLGLPPQVNLVVKALLVFAVMLLQSESFRAGLGRVVLRRSGRSAT